MRKVLIFSQDDFSAEIMGGVLIVFRDDKKTTLDDIGLLLFDQNVFLQSEFELRHL